MSIGVYSLRSPLMTVWKNILCPKKPGLLLDDVADLAAATGYPKFVYEGKIYNLTPGKGFADSGQVPEQYEQPDIFCVMDAETRIAMSPNGIGPLLMADPVTALILAEKLGGEAELFFAALWKQRQAREAASPIITPERAKLIVPGQ